MRILLTGATGFFGRALLRHWRTMSVPPQVIAVSRRPHGFFGAHPEFRDLPWFELHEGDVTRVDTLQALPEFEAVLHAATDSTLGPQLQPLEVHDQIVDGTRNVLELATARSVRRFLLTSSGGIYGRLGVDAGPVGEGHASAPDPLDVRNAYACAKRSAEHLCVLYGQARGLECVVARCFAFVGEDLPLGAHFAVGNFIRDALHESSIRVAGDGRTVRSYLDQRDLARWLTTLLVHGVPGRAYNVGSDRAITISELAHLTARILAPGKPVRILGGASVATSYVPDIGRARGEFGLDVSIPLEDAIRDAAAAHRAKIRS